MTPTPDHRLVFLALALCIGCERGAEDVDSLAEELASRPVETLVSRTADPDWRVRSAALIALDHREEPSAQSVAAACLQDGNARVRAHATTLLANAARRGDRFEGETIDALVRAVRDDDWSVRAHAIETLGLAGQDAAGAVSVVARALDDPHEAVRDRAVWTLGQFGAASLSELERIRRMAGDPNPLVRVQVPVAVTKIVSAPRDASAAAGLHIPG